MGFFSINSLEVKYFKLKEWKSEVSIPYAPSHYSRKCPGVDPATFPTELGILAVCGFGDMGKHARDSMVRDKFIAAQRNCGLCRHPDSASSDAPIRDIVNSCRVWESHSDRESSLDAGRGRDSLGMSDVSGRSCRSFRRVREWAREFQCPWLVWIRGVQRFCGR